MIEKILGIISVIVLIISTVVLGNIFSKAGGEIQETLTTIGQEISNFPNKVEQSNASNGKVNLFNNPNPVDICYMLTMVAGVAIVTVGATTLMFKFDEIYQ